MEYVLMHRNVPVMDCIFENDTLLRGVRIHNMLHVPVGVTNVLGRVENRRLRMWWNRRHVGRDRVNWDYIKSILHCDGPDILARIAYGCSLSDQYWIKPAESDILFEDVSFFSNEFDSDLFDLFLFAGEVRNDVEFHSPTCVTGGRMPKAWKVEDGKNVLYKAPGLMFDQEPYNEAIASGLGNLINANYVPYKLRQVYGIACVCCPCMLKGTEELVTAGDIVSDNGRVGKDKHSDIMYYINFAKKRGVQNIEKSISDMVLCDFLLRNGDRNWTNFGLIRDAETLKYLRPAPAFDFDSCLFYDTDRIDIKKACVSSLSGKSLYDDLQYCTCSDMRKVDQYPTLVRSVLDLSDLSRERKLKLQAFVTDRVDTLTKSACYRKLR